MNEMNMMNDTNGMNETTPSRWSRAARNAAALVSLGVLASVVLVGAQGARAFDTAPGGDAAGLPMVLPYEGFLSKDGAPVEAETTLTFSLWDGPHTDSATKLWTSSARKLTPSKGAFSVLLGDSSDSASIPIDAFRAPGLYVEVSVGEVALRPRQRVAPAAQAIIAAQALSTPYAQAAEQSVQDFTVQRDLLVKGDAAVQGTLSAALQGTLKTSWAEQCGTMNKITAACPANAQLLAGGCRAAGSDALVDSAPSDNKDGWTCYRNATGNHCAFAHCLTP